MIKACLLLVAGGFAAQHSRVPISSDLCKLSIVASLVLLLHPKTRMAGYVLLGFALFVQAGSGIVGDRLAPHLAGDSLLTQVRVVDFPTVTAASVILTVSPIADARLPPLSRVSWFEPTVSPEIGDTWELELRLRKPRGNSNPGLFDYEAWLFRRKIHAVGYVVNGKRNRLLSAGDGTRVDRFRQAFVARVLRVATERDDAAVLAAVGVGARHLVSSEQWDRYALTGTSHLMAISGLHVGLAASSAMLLALLIAGALRFVKSPYSVAIVFCVFVATAYAGISGFGVPAQRATLMLAVAAVVTVRRRQIDSMAVVAFAGALVFVCDPVATMTPGFNLSFAAVALLLWLGNRRVFIEEPRGYLAVAWGALRRLVNMQVFLLFGLMPLTVLIFQRVALLGTPANLLAVPLFSVVVVPFTLAGLVFSSLSEPAGHAALNVALLGIQWCERFIAMIVQAPFADITIARIEGAAWILVFMPALMVVLPPGWPGRWLAVLAVVALISYAPRPPANGCIDAHILDVGQGLAAVVRTERTTLVYDTGVSFRGGGSVAEQIVIPFLQSRGIRRIDRLVISHSDIDHSGGIAPLRERAEIGETFVGEWLPAAGPAAVRCEAGQHWQVDGVDFRFLHPTRDFAGAGNDASCVLLVRAGSYTVLFTGDIEAAAEFELVQRGELDGVDVVVVPHHGSLTSSTPPFVTAVSPRYAIVSAGYGNRWGFPKKRVSDRWAAVGAEVLNTAVAGAVSLKLCADGGVRELHNDRYERRRFWRSAH